MATPASIAIKREAAIGRLIATAAKLTDQNGGQPLTLPQPVRDTAEHEANTLTALADWLDGMGSVNETQELDLMTFTRVGLIEMAEAQGVTIPANANKSDIVEAIRGDTDG